MALLRLFDPTTQFQTKSGAINVAGKLRVYVESTDDLANIYGDDGSLLSQPLILDSNGRARGLFVDSGRSYRLEVYDRNDSLLFTIRRLEPNASGTIVNPTVFIKGTPDEIDVEDSVTEESRTYTVALSAKVTGEIAKIHTHSNKDVLDGITSDKVNSWDGKEDAFVVLPTTKGGTGTNAASKSALTSSLINSLSTGTSKPVDADYYVSQYQNGGTSNTSFVRRPVSALWEYIKDKISSVLGLTASAYSGKAATAGTADKAVADNSGNNIVNTYATKTELNAKQNNLTAGDNITIDGNTISSDQIFVATYGTTKYAEVKAAYNAGKLCTVFKDRRYYYVKWIDTASIMFETSDGKDTVYSLTLFSSDNWSTYTGQLQSKLTFDTTPTAGSTNPVTSDGIKTALDSRSFATKEYVDSMLGNVEQLLSEL